MVCQIIRAAILERHSDTHCIAAIQYACLRWQCPLASGLRGWWVINPQYCLGGHLPLPASERSFSLKVMGYGPKTSYSPWLVDLFSGRVGLRRLHLMEMESVCIAFSHQSHFPIVIRHILVNMIFDIYILWHELTVLMFSVVTPEENNIKTIENSITRQTPGLGQWKLAHPS